MTYASDFDDSYRPIRRRPHRGRGYRLAQATVAVAVVAAAVAGGVWIADASALSAAQDRLDAARASSSRAVAADRASLRAFAEAAAMGRATYEAAASLELALVEPLSTDLEALKTALDFDNGEAFTGIPAGPAADPASIDEATARILASNETGAAGFIETSRATEALIAAEGKIRSDVLGLAPGIPDIAAAALASSPDADPAVVGSYNTAVAAVARTVAEDGDILGALVAHDAAMESLTDSQLAAATSVAEAGEASAGDTTTPRAVPEYADGRAVGGIGSPSGGAGD